MKTAIAMGVVAALGLGIIGCTNSDTGAPSDNGGYGTAGNTVPGSTNTSSNSSAATPALSNQGPQPGINSNGDVSNGPNVNTGQGNNNSQDAVTPTK
jgi:hypothetical protein